ncbi:MAG: hypothetical protein LUC88_04755 [Prevotella sp.]|nr:hypothetical protein [Prevotella sp.]
MTAEEAQEILNKDLMCDTMARSNYDGFCRNHSCCDCEYDVTDDEFNRAVQVAIVCLAGYKAKPRVAFAPGFYKCPTCGNALMSYEKYCDQCGQKLRCDE